MLQRHAYLSLAKAQLALINELRSAVGITLGIQLGRMLDRFVEKQESARLTSSNKSRNVTVAGHFAMWDLLDGLVHHGIPLLLFHGDAEGRNAAAVLSLAAGPRIRKF
jgi:hypothetical protein